MMCALILPHSGPLMQWTTNDKPANITPELRPTSHAFHSYAILKAMWWAVREGKTTGRGEMHSTQDKCVQLNAGGVLHVSPFPPLVACNFLT